MSRCFGAGDLPGDSLADAARALTAGAGLWHLPQLPARGLHSHPTARTAALLEGIHVDAGLRGWVLTARSRRAGRLAGERLVRDLDWCEEHLAGPEEFKVQLCGPFSLACQLELPGGHRAIADRGALRDLTAALADAAPRHAADVAHRLGTPVEKVTVQLDEPWLAACLTGTVPGTHRFDEIPAVPAEQLRAGLDEVFAHCPGPRAVNLTRPSGPGAAVPAADSQGGGSAAGTRGVLPTQVWSLPGTLLIDVPGNDGANFPREFLDALGQRLDAEERVAVRDADASGVAGLLDRLGLREAAGLVDIVPRPAADPEQAVAAYRRAGREAAALSGKRSAGPAAR